MHHHLLGMPLLEITFCGSVALCAGLCLSGGCGLRPLSSIMTKVVYPEILSSLLLSGLEIPAGPYRCC